jgi:hypothetical protein
VCCGPQYTPFHSLAIGARVRGGRDRGVSGGMSGCMSQCVTSVQTKQADAKTHNLRHAGRVQRGSARVHTDRVRLPTLADTSCTPPSSDRKVLGEARTAAGVHHRQHGAIWCDFSMLCAPTRRPHVVKTGIPTSVTVPLILIQVSRWHDTKL